MSPPNSSHWMSANNLIWALCVNSTFPVWKVIIHQERHRNWTILKNLVLNFVNFCLDFERIRFTIVLFIFFSWSFITCPTTLLNFICIFVALRICSPFINQVINALIDLTPIARKVFKIAIYHILCWKINHNLPFRLIAESVSQHSRGGKCPSGVAEFLVINRNLLAIVILLTGIEVLWKPFVPDNHLLFLVHMIRSLLLANNWSWNHVL